MKFGLSAFILLLGAQSLEAQEDWKTPRFQSVLRDLSEFARDVDAGTRTLQKAFAREGQPQGMMSEIRALVHSYPELGALFLKYARSADEPFMGRALAVLALALPDRSHVATLMGDILGNPPDLKLALVALLGYSRTIQLPHLRDALETLGQLDVPPSWKLHPRSIMGPLTAASQSPDNVDLRPMLDGLLEFLNRREFVAVTPLAMRLGWDFSRRKEATQEQRTKVHELMKESYTEGDKGFEVALQYLLGHGTRRPPDLEFVARGLPKLAAALQVRVLSEIATFNRDAVFKPPFADYMEKAVEALSRPPADSGIEMGTMYYILRALKAREATDPAIRRLLENPSETLRRRLALVS